MTYVSVKQAQRQEISYYQRGSGICVARAMGLSVEKIRILARGAFLHDIGKMTIPDAILRKPGALTQAETEIMREHCARGYQMLKKIPFLPEVYEIVYSHQERYNGSGYPRALSLHVPSLREAGCIFR